MCRWAASASSGQSKRHYLASGYREFSNARTPIDAAVLKYSALMHLAIIEP
jgi:hypothetical protein